MIIGRLSTPELISESRDLPHTYKGQTTVITNISGDYCSICDEKVLDAAESRRVSAAMMAFNRQVNAEFVAPDFIVRVRKKLALVQLLKVLDRHPELLDEIRTA